MKWVLYDIGGVLELVDDDSWPQILEKRWSNRLGLTVEALRARLDAAELPDTTLQAGVEGEFWRKFAAALTLDDAEVAAMRAQLWDAYCGEANVGLLEHARSLRGRAGLAILSNSGDERAKKKNDVSSSRPSSIRSVTATSRGWPSRTPERTSPPSDGWERVRRTSSSSMTTTPRRGEQRVAGSARFSTATTPRRSQRSSGSWRTELQLQCCTPRGTSVSR